MKPYHASVAEVLKESGSDREKGLTSAEAEMRKQQNGPNKLVSISKRPAWRIFLQQFSDLLVIVLIIAGLIALYLGEYRDTVIMFLIVIINALIGFFQEYKAEKVVESLKNLVQTKARVIRNGKEIEVMAEELVLGDIVLLEEGVGVPADLRLVSSESFATNDFILTGESEPQSKNHVGTFAEDTAVTDQNNCVFMGVTVARGFASGVVVATGMNTEIGKIARTSETLTEGTSPLQQEINSLAKTITKLAGVLTVVLFGIQLFFTHGKLEEAFIFAIGIAVAMVPQGLPAQISVALSLGTGRMAKHKAVVKKLSAIETLGCASVIASDKTGTITKNEMTILHAYLNGELFSITGTGYAPNGQILDSEGKNYSKENLGEFKVFFLDGYLASTGKVNPPDRDHALWYPLGDPTEAAFATLALKAGYDLHAVEQEYSKIKVLPFDSDRKRITIIRDHKDNRIAFLKGGIESILEVSTNLIENNNVRPLTEADRKRFLELAKSYASEGKRVIALGYRDLGEGARSQELEAREVTKEVDSLAPNSQPLASDLSLEAIERDITFAGFAVMQDPPHEEVHQAVQEAFQASLKLVMITGDNAVTAKAIAQTIGMTAGEGRLPEVINGEELKTMSDIEIQTKLKARAVIFSRVSPSDKLRIVDLLKKQGEVVAVTGDGVNDTLSLKKAHIGVAMGQQGAEVAKEAADMILLDDNFSTIVVAIKEGRTIYKNLEKTILASLCANFGELTVVLLGFIGTAFFNLPIAILAVQILAVDLIGEVLPLTMLTFDPPEQELMKAPPRDINTHIVTKKRLADVAISGFLIGFLAFLSFLAVYQWHGMDTGKAQTAAYVSVVLVQLVNIAASRTDKTIFSRYFFSNSRLLVSFLLSILFVVLIVYLPVINTFLRTAPLSMLEWSYPVIGSIIFLVITEVRKIFQRTKLPA